MTDDLDSWRIFLFFLFDGWQLISMLLQSLRLTSLRTSWKCNVINVTMILTENRNCELLLCNRYWTCCVNFLLLFSFCSQFSTPCTFMATSKSGVKILIAPLLAVWRCFSLSSICKVKFVEWLGQTSWKPSCKLETLK